MIPGNVEDEDLSDSSYGDDYDEDLRDSSGTNNDSDNFVDESTDQFREMRNLTRKETKDVDTWRDLVTGVMVSAGCFVTTACFIYLSRDETETFQLAVRLDFEGSLRPLCKRTIFGRLLLSHSISTCVLCRSNLV